MAPIIHNIWGKRKSVEETPVHIPEGLIVFYRGNASSVPEGWGLGTGSRLVYCSSSYGGYGGSNSLSLQFTVNGSHSSLSNRYYYEATPANMVRGPQGAVAGQHTHSLSGPVILDKSSYRLYMIEALQDHSQFPPNAVVLSGNSSVSGLTRLSVGSGRLLGMALHDYALGNRGSNTAIIPEYNNTISTSGAHAHGTNIAHITGGSGSNNSGMSFHASSVVHGQGLSYFPPPYSMGHLLSHVGNISVSWSLRRVLLSAWYHASSNFDLQAGMYAFWKTSTAPQGWRMCDGTNGTLDLRDHFIQVHTGSEAIVGTGQLTINTSVELQEYNWPHQHFKNVTGTTHHGTGSHGLQYTHHSHSLAQTVYNIKLAHYSFRIIKYFG